MKTFEFIEFWGGYRQYDRDFRLVSPLLRFLHPPLFLSPFLASFFAVVAAAPIGTAFSIPYPQKKNITRFPVFLNQDIRCLRNHPTCTARSIRGWVKCRKAARRHRMSGCVWCLVVFNHRKEARRDTKEINRAGGMRSRHPMSANPSHMNGPIHPREVQRRKAAWRHRKS